MEDQNKYENGKIYKLIDKSNNDKVIYVGSTIQTLNERLRCHKKDSKIKPDIKVYKYICNVGWNNIDIILIENHNCNSKKELEVRERHYIDEFKPDLNSKIPTRTTKEYYEDNIEKITEYKKTWYNDNKEKITEYKKTWYNDNKEKNKITFICECGSELTKCKKSRHIKSLKHINYISSLNKK